MTHTEALNKILANACPMYMRPDGFNEYHIELCCHAFIITAKHNGDLTYEIKGIDEVAL